MKVNDKAVKHAKNLIENGDYSVDTDWSKAQPSTDKENKFIDDNGWDDYSKWFLGVNKDDDKDEKQRYGFPFGDFKKVHRSGLIAAKQRAAQNDHSDIESAADELLEKIDNKEGK